MVAENETQELGSAIEDESEAGTEGSPFPKSKLDKPVLSDRALSAQNELRIHELLALVACFAFPACGAWLLHAIRSQLSRRSESLISNYNLTIFLLAAEVRPASHLIKLVQRRTLFLQRTISAAASEKSADQLDPQVADIAKRLEELEAHVAGSVMLSVKSGPGTASQADDLVARASHQAKADVRQTLQPEVDALNRAMRRYEKGRMTAAIQVETRFQDLEARVQDVVILAAATQRNADKQYGRYTPIILNWISACVVVPIQYAIFFLTLPQRMLTSVLNYVKKKLGFPPVVSKNKDGKAASRGGQPRRRSKERIKS